MVEAMRGKHALEWYEHAYRRIDRIEKTYVSILKGIKRRALNVKASPSKLSQ